VYSSAQISLFHRLDHRSSVPSVTCMHTLLRSPPLKSMGVRGMYELYHGRERVGRPTIAFSRLVLSEERRVQLFPPINISLFHRLDRRFSVRSVTCMHTLLQTLTLMDMGARGMCELEHDQERVGRPSLTLPCPILGEYRRYHCRQDLALSALTLLIVHSRCDLPRA
jgi:hypothetical protein